MHEVWDIPERATCGPKTEHGSSWEYCMSPTNTIVARKEMAALVQLLMVMIQLPIRHYVTCWVDSFRSSWTQSTTRRSWAAVTTWKQLSCPLADTPDVAPYWNARGVPRSWGVMKMRRITSCIFFGTNMNITVKCLLNSVRDRMKIYLVQQTSRFKNHVMGPRFSLPSLLSWCVSITLV